MQISGYKVLLRMMGIYIDGPVYIFGDNISVLLNSSVPDSILLKKSNSIDYHFVQEASAFGEWLTAYIASEKNVADMLTKPLSGEKRKRFISRILHHAS